MVRLQSGWTYLRFAEAGQASLPVLQRIAAVDVAETSLAAALAGTAATAAADHRTCSLFES